MKNNKTYKEKSIAQLKINGETYSIRATSHALKRMEERDIDEYIVSGNIIALGKERLISLQSKNKDIIVIDENKNVAIVIGFDNNKIFIITVINKANVFVKDNTIIEKL